MSTLDDWQTGVLLEAERLEARARAVAVMVQRVETAAHLASRGDLQQARACRDFAGEAKGLALGLVQGTDLLADALPGWVHE